MYKVEIRIKTRFLLSYGGQPTKEFWFFVFGTTYLLIATSLSLNIEHRTSIVE
jgi:hypothetical protein